MVKSVTHNIYRFYSQHGEDCLLLEFFDYKSDGFYIDIGAFDGIHLSNTLTFEKMGWSGVCVEANPKYFAMCEESRPDSRCINSACSDALNESMSFFTDDLGLLSSIENSKEKTEDIKSRYTDRGLKFQGLKEITVSVTTVDEILKNEFEFEFESVEIDFISIDVEGHEMNVLKGFDIGKWNPRVIIIEANTIADEEFIMDYLGNRYSYCFSRKIGVNLFFTRSFEDSEKLAGIKIKCVIEKQMHPLGVSYTPNDYLAGKIINEIASSLISDKNKIIDEMNGVIKRHDELMSKIESSKRYRFAIIVLYPLDRIRSYFRRK